MTGHQGNYSNDHLWWDNVETLTGSLKRTNASTVTFTSNYSFRGDMSRNAQTYLSLVVSDVEQLWSIPASEVGDNELMETDELTDSDGVVWVIDQVTLITLGTSKLFWLAATHKKR